jgi:hypothetical protein
MNEEALKIFRQIRTCFVILTAIAVIWFAAWFLPLIYAQLRSAPHAWFLGIGLAVFVGIGIWLGIASREVPDSSQGS